MNILVDARSQQHSCPTGIGSYTRNICTHLLKTDIAEHLLFFQNSAKKIHTTLPVEKTISTHIPNKFLNLTQCLFNYPTLSQYARVTEHTPLFLPNINFASIDARSPYILTIHDLSFKHFPEWYSPTMRAWHLAVKADRLILNAKHLICVSESTAHDVMRTYRIDEKKISVIYPGIEYITPDLHSPIQHPYIIAVGSIEPRKNYTALLHAFSRVISQTKYDELMLIIIGQNGFQSQSIHKLANQLHLQNNVRFMGYVDEQTKHTLIAHARVLVYPSLFEGFGFPPLEAMLHGVPVIASWSSSLKEVCGEHAIYINPYHYEQLTDAISLILEDNAFADRLRVGGKKHATQFTWESCAQKTADVLKKVFL